MRYYELDPLAGDAPRERPQVILYVEDPLDRNCVEKFWVDFVAARICDRFGGEVELAWAVEDTRAHWGLVRGTKRGEAAAIVEIIERLRAEWAVWPERLEARTVTTADEWGRTIVVGGFDDVGGK